MNTALLAMALRKRAATMLDTTPPDMADEAHLRDLPELLNVLARIVEGRPATQAFGAPGDWGYSTPIGAALAARPETGEISPWMQPGIDYLQALAALLPEGWGIQQVAGDRLPWAIADRHAREVFEAETLTEIAEKLRQLPAGGCVAKPCKRCWCSTNLGEVTGGTCPACGDQVFPGYVLSPKVTK